MNNKRSYLYILLCVAVALFGFAASGFAQEASPAPAVPSAVPASPSTTAASSNPSSLTKEKEQIDFSNGLLQRGLYQMAVSEYEKFIADFPQSSLIGEAYFGLGEGYMFLNKTEEALQAFTRYKEILPDGPRIPQVQLRLAQLYIMREGYTMAEKTLADLNPEILDKPQQQTFYYYQGKTFQGSGDFDKAVEAFQKALAVPEVKLYTPHALFELGEIRSRQENYAEALDYYTKSLHASTNDEDKALSMFKQGEAQFLDGQYKVAAGLFKTVVDSYPQQKILPQALSMLLLSYVTVGEYHQALKYFTGYGHLIKEDGRFFDVFLVAARANLELQKYDEALALTEKILTLPDLKPEDKTTAVLKKAEILFKANRLEEAQSYIDQYVQANTASGNQGADQILFLKAEIFFGLKDYDQAIAIYRQVIEQFPESKFVSDALVGIAHTHYAAGKMKDAMDAFVDVFQKETDESKKSEALYNAVLIAARLGQTTKAVELCRLYIDSLPKGKYYEEVLFLLATHYAKLDNHADVLQTLERYTAEFPDSQRVNEIRFLSAYHNQMLGNNEKALALYGTIPADPGDMQFYYPALKNTAVIYLSQNQEAKAAEVFDKIITTFPKDDLGAPAYLWLMQYYLDQKRFDDALRIAAKAEERDPEQRAAVAFIRGEIFKEKKDCAQALNHYDVALEGPKSEFSGAAGIGKAVCQQALGQLDASMPTLQRVIEENQEDHTITMRARYEMANVEKARNNLEEAVNFYMLVGTIYENEEYSPEALFNAGRILEELKRFEEAQKVYQQVEELYPNSPFVASSKERLKALSESEANSSQ